MSLSSSTHFLGRLCSTRNPDRPCINCIFRSLSWSEKKFNKVGSPWARAALGGAIIGGMAYLNPSVLGEGYNITQEFLAQMDQHTVDWVLLFILLKFIACCVTLGSGGIGGVFAPSLVLGSAVGMSFGLILGLTGWVGWLNQQPSLWLAWRGW